MSAHNEPHAEEKPMHWAVQYVLGFILLAGVCILGLLWGGHVPLVGHLSSLEFETQRTVKGIFAYGGLAAGAIVLLLDNKKLRIAACVMIALGFIVANARL